MPPDFASYFFRIGILLLTRAWVRIYLMNQYQTQPVLRQVDLFTSDLYQFTCSYSYFVSDRHHQMATFEVFFRKYPFKGEYAILGGIRSVKEFIDNLEFTQEQEDYLKETFPHMDPDYFVWIRENLKKNIRIKSFKEGDLVFAKEPIITFTGPIGIVQLFETPILNLVGFSSLVATNASRMAKAVEPKMCIEFGIRRAQGPDGAMTASEFAYLGGFPKTSNITAAQKFNIPCVGTISHAYVTSFASIDDAEEYEINGVKILERTLHYQKELGFSTHQGELAAFIMYAKAYPDNFVALIDTYSTLQSGLLNTVSISKALVEAGNTSPGIRLDSGDLGEQSKKCREVWNQYFPDGPRLRIIASDDLYEERLIDIEEKGNEIDVFAIGTNIATCKKQPALGLVCKLVELNGKPKMKFSEDAGKATYPGKKTVYRIWKDKAGFASFDLIALESQKVEKKSAIVFDISKPKEPIEMEFEKIAKLNDYWEDSSPFKTLEQARQHFLKAKGDFNKIFDLKNPEPHPIYVTESYLKVFTQTLEQNSVKKDKYGQLN